MRNPTKTIFWALTAAVLAAGCADGPMAPELSDVELTAAFGKPDGKGPKGDGGDSSPDTTTTATLENVQWIVPLLQDVTVSKACEPSVDCVLYIAEVNTWLTVPISTLDGPTVITMTALAGTDVNFEFGPHGTQFKKPVKIKVDQARTNSIGVKSIWVKYWESDSANVLEMFEAKVFRGHILFETDHFSGYAIAM